VNEGFLCIQFFWCVEGVFKTCDFLYVPTKHHNLFSMDQKRKKMVHFENYSCYDPQFETLCSLLAQNILKVMLEKKNFSLLDNASSE
jgi:hypothetical protein